MQSYGTLNTQSLQNRRFDIEKTRKDHFYIMCFIRNSEQIMFSTDFQFFFVNNSKTKMMICTLFCFFVVAAKTLMHKKRKRHPTPPGREVRSIYLSLVQKKVNEAQLKKYLNCGGYRHYTLKTYRADFQFTLSVSLMIGSRLFQAFIAAVQNEA